MKLLKADNKDTTNDVIDVVLLSLLLALNRFQTLVRCFYCSLWTSKCKLGITFTAVFDLLQIGEKIFKAQAFLFCVWRRSG